MVYVDDPIHPYRGMLMCHMLADTSEELRAMAKAIGVQEKWIQFEGQYKEHFDISKTKRNLAIRLGATPIGVRAMGKLLKAKRIEHEQRERDSLEVSGDE